MFFRVHDDVLLTQPQDSLTDLTNLVEHTAKSVMEAQSLEWTANSFFSDEFKPDGSPLFALDLVFDEESQEFTLSTPIDPFEEALLSLFEKGISQTQGLRDIEPMIMKQMFWVGTPILETVDAREAWVSDLKARISKCIQTSAVPLMSYIKKYECYEVSAHMRIQF